MLCHAFWVECKARVAAGSVYTGNVEEEVEVAALFTQNLGDAEFDAGERFEGADVAFDNVHVVV